MSSGTPSVTPMNHSSFDAEPRVRELAYVIAATLPLHRFTSLVLFELKYDRKIMLTVTETARSVICDSRFLYVKPLAEP